jgi:hypothetical protein
MVYPLLLLHLEDDPAETLKIVVRMYLRMQKAHIEHMRKSHPEHGDKWIACDEGNFMACVCDRSLDKVSPSADLRIQPTPEQRKIVEEFRSYRGKRTAEEGKWNAASKQIKVMKFAVDFCQAGNSGPKPHVEVEGDARHGADANEDRPKIFTLSDKALMALDTHGGSTARVLNKRDTPGAGVEFDIYFPPGGYSLSYVSSHTSGKGTLTHIDLNEYIGYALKFTLIDTKSSTPNANKARLGVGANIGSPGRYRPAFIKLAPDKEPVTSSTGFEPAKMRSLDYLGFTAYLLTKEISNTDGLTITLKIEAIPGAHRIEPKKSMPDFLIVPGVRVGAITKETAATDLGRIYGAQNVEDANIPLGEGFGELGTILFPNPVEPEPKRVR